METRIKKVLKMIVDNFQKVMAHVARHPFEQALAVGTLSYLGFKVVANYPVKEHQVNHYIGKTIALIAMLGIMRFSGLTQDNKFLETCGFKFFRWGPFSCGTSMKNIRDMVQSVFDSKSIHGQFK